MRRSFLPLFLLPIFAVPSLSAQSASLVRDINTSASSQVGSDSQPSQLLAVGDKLFFVALAGDAGREVWVSDGTTYRTELLADRLFWFFGSENVELVVKILDGTAVNDHFWVFYGALSNVEYELTVTDTATGEVNVYTNPAGRFASVADTGAFEP